jgi:signal transduction histidine kinase
LARRSVEDALHTFATTHMSTGGREACERDPERFGGLLTRPPPERADRRRRPRPRERGPGRPAVAPERDAPDGRRGRERPPPTGMPRPPRHELWAYSRDFVSRNLLAPDFPAALRAELEAGEDTAGSPYEAGPQAGYQLAVRMAWIGGPCEIVLVRRFGGDDPGANTDLLWGALILCGVLLCAVLLVAGPIVRRIRRLTTQVRQSSARRYTTEVDEHGSDEITGLARAFNEAGRQLKTHLQTIEKRERTMRQFLGNTTHDVMLPLTVLQGHLSAMRKRLQRGDAVDADIVRYSLEEAQYMGSLIHNLSAVAKLEGGHHNVQRHPLDLVALVERATARQHTIASAREVELNHAVPENPVVVLGDVTLLEQAVSNLIHNAVRYNDEGGHVAVLLETRDGQFSLRILDDGPGIDEEQLARLPERRFRGEAARTRHPEGSGLGLHIAWDVARHHDFDLGFRRSEYGGLEAELSGPLAKGG